MKTFSLTIAAFALTATIFAQSPDFVDNVWLAADAADAQNWHNPANWSKGHVPTSKETALILDTYPQEDAVYPVIKEDASVAALKVHPFANMTIAKDVAFTITGGALDSDFSRDNVFNQGDLSYQLAKGVVARAEDLKQVKFCDPNGTPSPHFQYALYTQTPQIVRIQTTFSWVP